MDIPIQTEGQQVESTGNAKHRGPSLLGLGIVHTSIFIGSMILVALLTRGGHVPSPFAPAEDALAFFSGSAKALQLNAFLQLGAGIVLGLFTATAVSRLTFLGVRVAGLQIAYFGGMAAALLMILSALIQWVLAQPVVVLGGGIVHLFHLTFFAFGGIGYVAAAGLLMAGVSIPSGLMGLLPRWVVWLGLTLAGVSEFATLTLLSADVAYLLPVARLGSFVWLIGVGAYLPKSLDEAERARQRRGQAPVLASAH